MVAFIAMQIHDNMKLTVYGFLHFSEALLNLGNNAPEYVHFVVIRAPLKLYYHGCGLLSGTQLDASQICRQPTCSGNLPPKKKRDKLVAT
jgi:hypothetical protein